MWYPKSFASRLALAVLTTFGLIQIFLCAFIFIVREAELRSEFDDRLILRASTAVEAAEASLLRSGQLTLAHGASSAAATRALANVYWQLSTPDGAAIERSADLGEIVLPVPLPEAFESGTDGTGEHFETWSDPAVDALLGHTGALRIVSLPGEIEGEPPFLVQVARDFEPVTTSLASLRRHMLLAVGAGLLLSGVAAWVLARRVQQGIKSITHQARGITADAPERRIEPAARESELRQLAAGLNSMLDGLEQALRSREQFLADISHELKAPLTALAAEARMMAAASRASDLCRQLDNAVQSVVSSLTGATDGLLMLARCSGGSGGPTAQVSLNEVVTDAVAHCITRARPKGVRLIPMLPDADREEPVVTGHPDLLRVLVENLVRNAIDHSPAGGPIHVDLASDGRFAEIAVRDTGPGVSEDLLSHVFDPAAPARRPASTSGGHGLGLAIARRVVELHGGTIELANRVGGGCEVVVRLPITSEAEVSSS